MAEPPVPASKFITGSSSVSNLTSIATRNFSDLQNKPTTLSGYGITDATSLTYFNYNVGYATGVGDGIDAFISYLVDTGLENGEIDTHLAALPVFTIDFNPLTVSTGDAYYGECKLVGDGVILLFDIGRALAASTLKWTIAEDTDIFATVGISDSPTKQQIINKLVVLSAGKITDLGGLIIQVAPTDHDLEPIKFTVPIGERNAGFTYLGTMTGSVFVSGNNNIGILRQRGWTLVGAFAHLDATSGAVAITKGGTNATTASGARTALGLAIGTNVQAYDADLTTWAGITPGTGVGTALGVNVGSAGAFGRHVAAPSTAASTGTAGDYSYDSSFFYICAATNTWKRIAIATW